MKSTVVWMTIAWSIFVIVGCGDDTGGRGDASSAECPDISGTWTIEMHCEASLVGDQVVVAQDGCDFSDETFGFSGTVEADGTVHATANASGTDPTTCTGMATASTLSERCTGFMAPCDVLLRR